MCCRFHTVIKIVFTIYIFALTLDAFFVNKTNILYQYAILCGPEFYDDSVNLWSFPEIPMEYKICPNCTRDKKCLNTGTCCPDLYVLYPQRQCTEVQIYSSEKRKFIESYDLIATCPQNTPQYVIHEKCVKPYEMKEKMRTPPVTSVSTGLSFKNKFCADCHNISDVVQWRLMINNTCQENLESSTVDEMFKIMVDRKCGSIDYCPVDKMPPKICHKAWRSHIIIDSCNVSGTWKKYDSDIDFACRTFDNDFKFYKNIFCYLCNPPDVLDETSVIGHCNVTGKWKHYSKIIVDACFHGDATVASYPFKNIYCYVCNTDVPRRNSFSLSVVSRSLCQYYIFNISERYGRFMVNNGTQSCPYNRPRYVEYHKWENKIECESLLPISILETEPVPTLQRLAEKGNCTVYTSKEGNHSTVPDFELSSQYFKDITWAFPSRYNIHSFIGTYNLSLCFSCSDNLCTYLKNHYKYDCSPLYIDMAEYRLPLEYIICHCCSSTERGIIFQDKTPKFFNIFYIDAYETMSQKCHGNEIYDSTKEKCRYTGCFVGKKINNELCEQDKTPVATFENKSRPLIGYTLPLRFDLHPINKNNRSSIYDIFEQLHAALNDIYNIKVSLCLTMLRNETKISFILQIDYKNGFDRMEDERRLLQFVSELILNKTRFNDIDIVYDQITNDFVNPPKNLSECKQGWRPLLSNILICRHVNFDRDEYNEVDGKVKINGFRNIFYFYQYYIDVSNKLWLCVEDFDKLQEDGGGGGSDLVYFVILISCNMISVVFLLMTITTYCIFPNLRTVPGKNIMSLSVSLTLHYITFSLVMLTNETGAWCKILAVFAHYFLLSSFGCLSVCAWHMFKIFGPGSIASSMAATRNKHVTCWYLIYTYVSPLILITGNIIFSVVSTSGVYIGYGDRKCFISSKESVIATLIVPLTLLSGVDIILYSVTVYTLRQRPNMNNNTMDKKDVWIFIKLFTTTGCSWILLLINVFIYNQVVTVIIASINSLQGLYIFLAYVFNKRIYNMYASKFRLWKCNKKIRSPSTSLTSLSRTRTQIVEQSSPFLKR